MAVQGASGLQGGPAAEGAGSGVTLPTALTRLTLAGADSVNDPGSRLAASITDGGAGVGLEFQVTGGWSSTDPLDWPHIIWTPRDLSGNTLSTSDAWALYCELAERTAAGLSSDSAVWIGLVNETADSGTIDGTGFGWGYSGANRRGASITIANGAATRITTSGSGGATLRYATGAFSAIGVGSGRLFSFDFLRGPLDSSRAPVATPYGSTSPTSIVVGAATPRIVVAVGRTATTAGTETIRIDPYYLKPLSLALEA